MGRAPDLGDSSAWHERTPDALSAFVACACRQVHPRRVEQRLSVDCRVPVTHASNLGKWIIGIGLGRTVRIEETISSIGGAVDVVVAAKEKVERLNSIPDKHDPAQCSLRC